MTKFAVGSVVVPATKFTSPVVVALVSVMVNTPAFCTVRLAGDDPPRVTVRELSDEVNLSVPLFAANVPQGSKTARTLR